MLKLNESAWRLHDELGHGDYREPRQRPRIGVIWNPRSHRNVGHALDRAAHERDGVRLSMPMTKLALAQTLARFAAEGIDTLIINGGDGTVRDVLSYGAPFFGDAWPRLAMVPRGKTNALAIDLGLPRNWSLDEALAATAAGTTMTRRPIVIERAHERPLWGFIFGAGAFNAAIDTGQVAHRLGAFQSAGIGITFAMGLIEALFGIGNGPWRRTAPMDLQMGGESEAQMRALPHSGRGGIESRYLALFSTLRTFPLGIAPFRESDRDIRYLLIDSPIRRVTGRLPLILRGADALYYPALGIHRGAGTAFRMDLGDRFVLDGEAFGPSDLSVRQGPELEFVVP